MSQRQIISISPARQADMGELFTRISLSGSEADMLDPYLILAHHGPQNFPSNSAMPPIPPHPHRGFETVTFILDGELRHRDSAGHQSLIHTGGVQWLTAGAGVVHSEVAPEGFWQRGGGLEILQIWINLPSHLKMSPPRYQGVERKDLLIVPLPEGAGTLNHVSGEFAGARGPVESPTDVFMSTVSLHAGSRVELPTPTQRQVLFYVVNGRAKVGSRELVGGDLAKVGTGDSIEVAALEDTLILFSHADEIKEAVVASGPFVMNTEAEIRQAHADYRAGRLGQL